MKKRVLPLLAVCLLLACIVPVFALIAERPSQASAVTSDDTNAGTLTQTTSCTTQANGTQVGHKEIEYRCGSGAPEWRITLTAVFTYNASGGRCVYVYPPTVTIYHNDWSVAAKTSARDGDTAIGSVTMSRKLLSGSSTLPVSLTLTCDETGNLK